MAVQGQSRHHAGWGAPSHHGVLQRLLCLALASAANWQRASAVVFSAELDHEVATLHGKSEELWVRIGNLTSHLQAAGAMGGATGALPAATLPTGAAGALPAAALPTGSAGMPLGSGAAGQQGLSVTPRSAGSERISQKLVDSLRKLQSDSAALQRKAFQIGRESTDNDELSRHPEVNDYISNLRSFNTQLEAMVRDLESECKTLTGSVPEAPKKKKKKAKKGQKSAEGLSEVGIRAGVQKRLAGDTRPYRSRAMDIASSFRERQLQMQDKQRDLQLTMDGPDWPREDWPLSTADAQHVSEAEELITLALGELNSLINPLGGLGRVHESDSEPALEQLSTLGELMSGYIELIDRHVATVKRAQKGTKKSKKTKKPSKLAGAADQQVEQPGGSLRDRLMSFGSQPAAAGQPFAWLKDEGASGAPAGFGGFGVLPQQPQAAYAKPFGGAQAATHGAAPPHGALPPMPNPTGSMFGAMGSSLGSLGSQGAGFGSRAFADHKSAGGFAQPGAGFGAMFGGLSQAAGGASASLGGGNGFGGLGARHQPPDQGARSMGEL